MNPLIRRPVVKMYRGSCTIKVDFACFYFIRNMYELKSIC